MSKAEELPSEADWQEWLLNPCTKALRAWAHEEREELKDQWASGAFSDAFDVAMAVKNAGATGACSIYVLIEELDFQLIIGGATNEKSERPQT